MYLVRKAERLYITSSKASCSCNCSLGELHSGLLESHDFPRDWPKGLVRPLIWKNRRFGARRAVDVGLPDSAQKTIEVEVSAAAAAIVGELARHSRLVSQSAGSKTTESEAVLLSWKKAAENLIGHQGVSILQIKFVRREISVCFVVLLWISVVRHLMFKSRLRAVSAMLLRSTAASGAARPVWWWG